jgi:hypothetical protein
MKSIKILLAGVAVALVMVAARFMRARDVSK